MEEKILLVDDEPHILALYEWLFEGRITVDTARSGEEGLHAIQANGPYAVVVSDQNMQPGINGFEFLARVKEQSPATVCIVLTGLADLDVVIAAVNSGQVFRFIRKPCGMEFLGQCIEAGLAQHRSINAAHRRSEQLVASLPSIVIGMSEDDSIIQWNQSAEKIFGLTAADVLGRPLKELNISWDWPAVLRAIADSREDSGAIRLNNVQYTRTDGKNGVLGLTLTQLASAEEESSGVLILGADITERRLMEAQLRQAQKLESIGQLAAGIAHEINTPTQYVGDNTRFLQSAFGDLVVVLQKVGELTEAAQSGPVPATLVGEVRATMERADVDYLITEIPDAIQQSLKGIERVSQIVRAMKEFSHPGAEEKRPLDLNQAIGSTIIVARNEWKYVAAMVTDLDPELPPVPCLADDISQVILNLIVNAAHAIADAVDDGSRGKGTITISTRQVGEWAEIQVADTGTGIPQDIRNKIFDPFFTTKDVGKGTGQGLSITHSVVVKKHGGTITVDSEVGKGTTFLIRLPMVDPARVAEERRTGSGTHQKAEARPSSSSAS